VLHFRDTRSGDFHLDKDPQPAGNALPLLRFASGHGFALDPWEGSNVSVERVLHEADLAWEVDPRPVLVPYSDGTALPVRGYRSLVRPRPRHEVIKNPAMGEVDSLQVMSVVTSAYAVAENHWVAEACLALARQFDREASVVAATGFGRTNERTLFAVRLCVSRDDVVLLLAYNQHGGDGAVRFQVVRADRQMNCILVPDADHGAVSVPHVGDVRERLDRLRFRDLMEKYDAEVTPLWRDLPDRLWTPRHTAALIKELWGDEPSTDRLTPDGRPLLSDHDLRHPKAHLTRSMHGCTDALTAYRLTCQYLDHRSEACEKGDFTKDRDERLALGAGTKHKQRAWRWIVTNT
jgi:hypothetical protein